MPPAYAEMFSGVSFPLPPNYRPDDDPHGDRWSQMSPSDRCSLPQWMRVYQAMTANLDWNIGRLLAAMIAWACATIRSLSSHPITVRCLALTAGGQKTSSTMKPCVSRSLSDGQAMFLPTR